MAGSTTVVYPYTMTRKSLGYGVLDAPFGGDARKSIGYGVLGAPRGVVDAAHLV